MSKIKIVGHASGTGVLTIAAPNTNTDRTITIPDVTGTLLDSGSDLPAANITGTLPANSIDSDNYVDGSIDTAHLANDVVSLAKMAHGTDGELITYDTSGAPAFVAVGSVGQVLTSAGAGQPPAFAAAAATVGGASGVDFNDSVKVRFGAGNDLELYSDGNSSFIKDNGSGEFYIRGTNIILKSGVDNDDYIKCNENSDVKIYYSNAEKLATTSTGATVTGTLVESSPTNAVTTIVTNDNVAVRNFGSSFANVDTTWYKWDLPSSGTYLIGGNYRAIQWTRNGFCKVRLYNNTASAAINNSDRMLLESGNNSNTLNVGVCPTWVVTVTAATLIYLQGKSSSPTGSGGSGIQEDYNGNNECWHARMY
mgnify:CR=1 FL=1